MLENVWPLPPYNLRKVQPLMNHRFDLDEQNIQRWLLSLRSYLEFGIHMYLPRLPCGQICYLFCEWIKLNIKTNIFFKEPCNFSIQNSECITKHAYDKTIKYLKLIQTPIFFLALTSFSSDPIGIEKQPKKEFFSLPLTK